LEKGDEAVKETVFMAASMGHFLVLEVVLISFLWSGSAIVLAPVAIFLGTLWCKCVKDVCIS
jgi:hypothetical protein